MSINGRVLEGNQQEMSGGKQRARGKRIRSKYIVCMCKNVINEPHVKTARQLKREMGRALERVIEGVNMIKVYYMHVWKFVTMNSPHCTNNMYS
jgi:hypothetical protein